MRKIEFQPDVGGGATDLSRLTTFVYAQPTFGTSFSMSTNRNENGRNGLVEPFTADRHAEAESWLSDFIDLRVIVFLVSVAVVAMTATVLILPGIPDVGSSNSGEATFSTDVAGSISPNPEESQTGKSDAPKNAVTPAPAVSGQPIAQSGDGSFDLPVRSAAYSGCQPETSGIKNWKENGWAQWQLDVRDRRTGFFYCFVTYQAESECQFAVQLGDRRPVKFSVYPQSSDFTEEFIVRLDSPQEPSFRIYPTKIDEFSEPMIKAVRLEPRSGSGN